jgi:hypothetical protein
MYFYTIKYRNIIFAYEQLKSSVVIPQVYLWKKRDQYSSESLVLSFLISILQ